MTFAQEHSQEKRIWEEDRVEDSVRIVRESPYPSYKDPSEIRTIQRKVRQRAASVTNASPHVA